MNILFSFALLLSVGTPAHAAQAKPSLSQVQIQKLLGLTKEHGHDSHVDPDLAKAIGLTQDMGSVTLRQLTMRENPQSTHSFQQMPSAGGLILALTAPDGLRVYRTNARQEVVAAAVVAPNKTPAAIPLAAARKELKAELTYWSSIADQVR